MTRMQLVRTLAAWRPDMGGYREMETAYRIALKSLARRYLELHDEVADLDVMIKSIVDELAPELVTRLVTRNSIGYGSAACNACRSMRLAKSRKCLNCRQSTRSVRRHRPVICVASRSSKQCLQSGGIETLSG